MPWNDRNSSNSSTGSGSNLLGHSTESINDTWRSVDDMTLLLAGGSGLLEDGMEDKLSPSSYSVGRVRSASNASVGSGGSGSGGSRVGRRDSGTGSGSGGSRRGSATGVVDKDLSLAPLDLSPSGKSMYSASSSSGSGSGGGSLHGENISTSTPSSPSREPPNRERTLSNMSNGGGSRVVGRISEGSSDDNSGGVHVWYG